MKHLNNLKDETFDMDNVVDPLLILYNCSQEILDTLIQKNQINNNQKQECQENENFNYYNNIENYIQFEKENKIIIDNNFEINETDEESNDTEDDEYNDDLNSQISSLTNLGEIVNTYSQEDNQMENQTIMIQKQISSQSIQDNQPFLPQINQKYKYTLVLDLDETLIHYREVTYQRNLKQIYQLYPYIKQLENQSAGEFLIRPYVEYFLNEMSKYYEIVIFTAAIQQYADWILDLIDRNRSISFKLYRQHTSFDGKYSLKDLSKIGRDLSKTIIIDNLPENFSKQPENGIFIQSWFGERDDRALYDLAPLLKQIVEKECEDVRVALRKFSDLIEENIRNGIQYPHLNLNL